MRTKVLVIPEGTKYIEKEAYLDNPDIEEIIFPDSVEEISQGAFARMTSLKRIVFSSNLRILRESAFANCPNLEEVVFQPDCPLMCFDKGIFSYCQKLKKINIPKNVNHIMDYALYNCKSLEELTIPDNVCRLGVLSLSRTSLKKIFIPKSILTIEHSALANIQTLEEIEVDEQNKTYMAVDNGTLLLNKLTFIALQYAINNKQKKYTLPGTINGDSICGIGEHAFEGTRHLEELTIYSNHDFIGMESFKNCNKLKKLNVKLNPTQPSHVLISMPLQGVPVASLPFKEVSYDDGILSIAGTSNIAFENLTILSLPNDVREISNDIYFHAPQLKEAYLPSSIESISSDAFHPNTKIIFADGFEVIAKDFSSYRTKLPYKILSLKNGTHFIHHQVYGNIIILEDELDNLSPYTNELKNEPERIISYLLNMYLLYLKDSDDSFYKTTYQHIFAGGINYHNPFDFIKDILQRKANYNEPLLNGILMDNLKIPEATKLIQNYSFEIEEFFKHSNALTISLDQFHDNVNGLISYCSLLKKYNQKDHFLLSTTFLGAFNITQYEVFIKNFDPHIKRMIIASKALETENPTSAKQNIHDLYVLASMLGAYNGNPMLKQKATNFITEKICADYVSDGQKNEYQIAGDDLHSIFHGIKLRAKYDEKWSIIEEYLISSDHLDTSCDVEFVCFFIDNYQELLLKEKEFSGFISRVYNAFPDIYITSTSNKGIQRHLKVTVEKAENYLLENKFSGITPENKHIANFISPWFDKDEDFQNALKVVKESKKAPRNIFAPFEVKPGKTLDSSPHYIFDNSPKHDLKEEINENFSYEWLPKQELENLVLGKYCNCCAHIAGSQGTGIMRASMVSPHIQNMVIRDSKGAIIAKATLYVNRNSRYAIFNTLEVSLSHKDLISIENIYNAFMRGAKSFMEVYNQNNIHNSLEIMTIGETRNNAIYIMRSSDIHRAISPYQTFNWGEYSFNETNYYADAKEAQRVVISK